MTDYQDVIAGFVDSEPVEAHALGDALARPEGREYLIDLLVLRGLVGDAHARPVAVVRTSVMSAPLHRGRWLLSVAAFLTMGVAAGFLAGRLMFVRGQVSEVRPPIDVVMPAIPVAAPAPTHVIRMEKGVDWNERSGGN